MSPAAPTVRPFPHCPLVVAYGLGVENENLPGYVLLNNDWIPNGGYENFSSAFLPATPTSAMGRGCLRRLLNRRTSAHPCRVLAETVIRTSSGLLFLIGGACRSLRLCFWSGRSVLPKCKGTAKDQDCYPHNGPPSL